MRNGGWAGLIPYAQNVNNNEQELQESEILNIPNFYIERVTLENNVEVLAHTDDNPANESQLFLTSNLLIYSEFAANSEYLKFFENPASFLFILEITNKKWKNILQQSSELIAKLVKYSQNKDNNVTINSYFLNLAQTSNLIGKPDAVEFLNSFKSNSNLIKVPALNPSKVESALEDGQPSIKMYFKKKSQLPNNTTDLSYFIFGQSQDFTVSDEIKVSGEVVLANNKLRSITYTFYDTQDNVWVGDVHQRDGEWYKGKYSEYNAEFAQKLNRVSSYNRKLQDFRTLSKLESQIDNFDSIVKKRKIVDDYINNLENNSFEKESNNPITFTRLASPLDFSIDLGKIYKTSRIYNSLRKIPNPDALEFEVKAFKIRVSPTKKTSGFAHASFETIRPLEKNWQKQYVRSRQIRDMTREIKFSILDSVSNFEFCYGVELYYSDPFIEPMRRILENSRQQIAFLKIYYQNCLFSQNYDYSLNKFTEEFLKWHNNQNKIKVKDIVSNYLELVDLLTDEDVVSDEEIGVFLSCLEPTSGTPSVIGSFLDSFERVLMIFEKIYEKAKKGKISYVEKIFDNKTERVSKSDIGKRNKGSQSIKDLDLASISAFYEKGGVTVVDISGKNIADKLFITTWDNEAANQVFERRSNLDNSLLNYNRLMAENTGKQKGEQLSSSRVLNNSAVSQTSGVSKIIAKDNNAMSSFASVKRQSVIPDLSAREVAYLDNEFEPKQQSNLFVSNSKMREAFVEQSNKQNITKLANKGRPVLQR